VARLDRTGQVLTGSYDKQLTGSHHKQLITLSLPLSLRLDRTGRFVTGSYDKQLITWQVNKSEPETIVEGERVTDLAVSKDGRRLVMMTADKKIQMFALPSMSPLARAAAISEVMLEVMLVYASNNISCISVFVM
jgi:WD40 repeat protein